MKYPDSSVFVTGQAKPSKEDAISSVYQIFSLSLVVDKHTDTIIQVACTTAMMETRDFISSLLCGKNLITDMDLMLDSIKTRFFALVQKTLIVALKDAQNRYLMAFPEKRK